MKARVTAVADPEMAIGFRLAGIEVETVDVTDRDAEAGRLEQLLGGILEKREPMVIFLDERYLSMVSERLQARIEQSLLPLFVPYPHVESWRSAEGKEVYLARLLQRIMGFQIRIRR